MNKTSRGFKKRAGLGRKGKGGCFQMKTNMGTNWKKTVPMRNKKLAALVISHDGGEDKKSQQKRVGHRPLPCNGEGKNTERTNAGKKNNG